MVLEYKNLFFIYSIGLTSLTLLSVFTYLISYKYSIILNKRFTSFIFALSLIFYLSSALYLASTKINALHHYLDFATHLEILWRNSQGLGLTSLMSEKFWMSSHWFAAHFTPIIYLTYVPVFSLVIC